MKDKITAFVRQNNLISNNDTVLIAFSGGADSVFLADYLLSIKEEFNLTLKLAHVEHGIRGQESLNDCKFSKAYANNNNIEFFVFHINAVEEAKNAHMGVEEYSRLKRYEFFRSIECDKIATAHNLTDNVETMLFRTARGTSVRGLSSIPVCRDNIIRPLLCVTGEQIRAYLDDNNIPYCTDSTNLSNDYSRNYIRNVIIPEFKNVNSGFLLNAARLIENAAETEDAIKTLTDTAYENVCKDNKLLIDRLNSHPKAITKRLIIKYFEGFGVQLDSKHLNCIYSLLSKNGKIQIKGNNFAVSDGKTIRFCRFESINFDELAINKQIINIDFDTNFLNNCELLNKKFDFYCDYDKIIGNVFVRQRLDGDKITPAKRDCTKTLKKLFNEYHIPVEKRSSIPVICDNSGVIGVYGYCADERVKTDNNTRNVLVIDIRMDTEDKN